MQKRKAIVAATLGATLIGSMALMADNHFNNVSSNNSASVNTKDNHIYNQTAFNNKFRLNVNKAIHKVKPLTKAESQYIKQLSKKTQINMGNILAIAKIGNEPIYIIKSKELNESTKVNKKVVKVQKQIDTNNTQYKWLDIPLTHNQQKWVFDLCKRNGIDAYLVFAIMFEESNFENCESNLFGCIGYNQINQVTANHTLEWLKKNDYKQYEECAYNFDLYDYYTNCHIAICTLKKLFLTYPDDIYYGLIVYGMGTGGAENFVKKYGYIQPKFMRKWFSYQQQYQTYGKIVNEKVR